MVVDTSPWVGQIRSTEALLVYDPSLQLANHSQLFVYSLNLGAIRQFAPAELRAIVRTVHGAQRETALAEYYKWKRENGEAFLLREPLRLEEESRRVEAEAERIREAHRQRLISLGIDPASITISPVAPRSLRVTHCYACKRHLDNQTFLECSACNWIICNCGACGCGYAP